MCRNVLCTYAEYRDEDSCLGRFTLAPSVGICMYTFSDILVSDLETHIDILYRTYVVQCIRAQLSIIYHGNLISSLLCGTKGERSSSGLLEWESINDAMEALAMMNHYQMKNPSKWSSCYINIPKCFLKVSLVSFTLCCTF